MHAAYTRGTGQPVAQLQSSARLRTGSIVVWHMPASCHVAANAIRWRPQAQVSRAAWLRLIILQTDAISAVLSSFIAFRAISKSTVRNDL